ncbi:MAG: polymer-forming cytoskeletal protein [Desulfobulbaceae bacterium]|nr:polymer-forming cytoskeletal protein [Desulfobulbaceae bacterium]
MSIFKKDDLKQEAAKASKEAISTIISKDMTITGEVVFKGKARIDGTIEGNVKGEYLVLSESGKIKGDVELDSLICHGTIEGDVNAKLVTAQTSAVIIGRLSSANLTVESGATIEGEIRSITSNKDNEKATSNINKKNPLSSPSSVSLKRAETTS